MNSGLYDYILSKRLPIVIHKNVKRIRLQKLDILPGIENECLLNRYFGLRLKIGLRNFVDGLEYLLNEFASWKRSDMTDELQAL